MLAHCGQEQCSTSRKCPLSHMRGSLRRLPPLPAKVAHAILQDAFPTIHSQSRTGYKYTPTNSARCRQPQTGLRPVSGQANRPDTRTRPMPSMPTRAPHAQRTLRSPTRRRIPAHATPQPQPPRPKPPEACAERPRDVRAGQARGARAPAQYTCQSTEGSRAGRGRERGSGNPSASAHVRFARRGRLVLLVAGRQEAVRAAAHAVIPLAPLLLPCHVLWPRILRRVLCDARDSWGGFPKTLVSSTRLQSAKPCTSDMQIITRSCCYHHLLDFLPSPNGSA